MVYLIIFSLSTVPCIASKNMEESSHSIKWGHHPGLFQVLRKQQETSERLVAVLADIETGMLPR